MSFDIKGTLNEAFSGVFIVRLIAGIVSAGATAWVVSFVTADYVVRANTSSANTAMSSLQASIDNFNNSFQATTASLQGSIEANTRSTDGLQEQMAELLVRSENQSATLMNVQDDLGRVAAAVQDAGIDVRISAQPDDFGAIRGFADLYEALGVAGDGDLYIKFPRQEFSD